MADNNYTCKQCNVGFIASRKRSFCTVKCRYRHETLKRNPNARVRVPVQECTCKGCGKVYLPKEANRNKYCSRECAFKSGATSKYVRDGKEYDRPSAYTKIYFKVCQHCSKLFVAKTIKTPTCSDKCKKGLNNSKEYKRNLANKVITTISCKNCKKLFVAEYSDKKRIFCSSICSISHGRRIGKAKRRAVERSIEAENIDPFKVFDRDKWKCCLCGIKTPKTKRGGYDDASPELDHIIPLSKGGKHTYSNVQCACRKCNQTKGDKELGQLLLFG